MDIFERNGLSPDKMEASEDSTPLSVTLIQQNNNIVVVGFSEIDPTINHCLYEKGYRIVMAHPDEALETIRWEQPALALINGGLHGEGNLDLLRRLNADRLTQNINLILWVAEAPGGEQGHTNRWVVDSLKGLRSVLRYLPSLRKVGPGWKEVAPAQSSAKEPTKKPSSLQELWANPLLRKFIDDVVADWPTLRLATFLGEHFEAVVNVEMVCNLFECTMEESTKALAQLSQAGYLEPLEFDDEDPLFGLVAEPMRVQLLTTLEAAFKVPSYRMTVATLILARERAKSR
ncbi:MAG: hypothetical protein WCS37_14830 [Chloroflexota bacterium]|nr:hypothetical protein [Chloroflexota bacterium]